MKQGEGRMIPRKYGPMLFGLILSGLMSLLVSGISALRAVGLGPDLADLWMRSWLTAWPVAFPAVLLVAPIAQKTVGLLVAKQ